MKPHVLPRCLVLALPLLGACTDESLPTASPPPDAPVRRMSSAPAPLGLATVSFDGRSLRFWPYTDTNFEATPQDPMNLVFVGRADARNIRSALLSLDGNRSVYPFTESGLGALLAGVAQGCRWTDAVGGNQTTYSEAGGWSGSVIQLECGGYNSFRYHLRLFPAGEWTVANAHAEVLIPGTNGHEVLSWEAGEKFVTMELVRSGLLAALPTESGTINEVGSFGTILPAIYNGLPDSHPLRILSGGPLTGAVSTPVGKLTDGRATVLALRDAPPAAGTTSGFTINFGQFIPKPFCARAGELVRVDGPVQVSQVVSVTATGAVETKTLARGTLTVRSFNPLTGELGPAAPAEVEEEWENEIEDGRHFTSSKSGQRLLPDGAAPQEFSLQLEVGSDGTTIYLAGQECG